MRCLLFTFGLQFLTIGNNVKTKLCYSNAIQLAKITPPGTHTHKYCKLHYASHCQHRIFSGSVVDLMQCNLLFIGCRDKFNLWISKLGRHYPMISKRNIMKISFYKGQMLNVPLNHNLRFNSQLILGWWGSVFVC